MPTISGGCLCGQVRYRAETEPTFVGLCHCRDCQRFTGSAFALVIAVPKSALAVMGTLKGFTKLGNSGKSIDRLFCPDCGAPILDEAQALPGVAMIAGGTLDDPSWVRPTSQIYCASAQPWVELGGDMKKFDGVPE